MHKANIENYIITVVAIKIVVKTVKEYYENNKEKLQE